MLRNYLKVIFRILTRNKLYSFINVSGLAVGFACCTLVLVYVRHELSYDRYHEDANLIYRVALNWKMENRELRAPISAAPLAPLLKQENPQVLAAARFQLFPGEIFGLKYKDQSFLEHRFWWADQDVFEVLSIPITEGDRSTTLVRPNTVAISESMARKYFRNESPIGKTMIMNSAQSFEVTAVYQDQPVNSHLHFDFLASLQIREEHPSWTKYNYVTYIKITPNGNPKVLADEINRAVKSSKGGEALRQTGGSTDYFLQKVVDIHLYSDLDVEIEPGGDVTHVYVFFLIATFILVIAAVNFVNLTMSMAGKRSKEIGVRKTAGAQRRQLAQQLIGESVVLSLFAALFALIFIDLLLPWFNEVTGKEIEVGYLNDPSILIGFLAIALLTGLLAAIYPAIIQSGFLPDRALRQGAVFPKRKGSLRNILIVTQFAISSALILGTLGLSEQLNYLQSKHLGFEKANLLFISLTSDIVRQKFKPLKEKWLQNPDVLGVTRCSELPGFVKNAHRIKMKGANDEEAMLVTGLWVDFDFLKTLGAEISQGRTFSPDFSNDPVSGCVINESMAKLMGEESKSVGQMLTEAPADDGNEGTEVIGVVADFHFQPLRSDILPLVIYMKNNRVIDRSELPKVLIRISDGDPRRTIGLLERDWHEIDPNAPFEIGFLDQRTNSLYKSDLQLSRIFGIFATVALVLASLGIFALAAAATEYRTKEIGIRKAMGASMGNVLFHLSAPFLKLVVLANAIAWPITYYWLRQWYEGFVYRTVIDLELFLITGSVALMIAFSAIAFHTVKTALANPVDALKYE